jgi:hypothetical protein
LLLGYARRDLYLSGRHVDDLKRELGEFAEESADTGCESESVPCQPLKRASDQPASAESPAGGGAVAEPTPACSTFNLVRRV